MSGQQSEQNVEVSFAPLSLLMKDIPNSSYSCFARYLDKACQGAKVPVAIQDSDSAFAVGGAPLGRPEAAFHWIYGDRNVATSTLLRFLRDKIKFPQIYFPANIMPVAARHFPVAEMGIDYLFVHRGRNVDEVGETVEVIHFASHPTQVKIHNQIMEKFPPPEIWARCKFKYSGLVVSGEVVSVLEHTVEDGSNCAVQQVFTPDEYRGKGYARTLVGAAVKAMTDRGISPIYLCNSQNRKSVHVATQCGFELESVLGVVGG